MQPFDALPCLFKRSKATRPPASSPRPADGLARPPSGMSSKWDSEGASVTLSR